MRATFKTLGRFGKPETARRKSSPYEIGWKETLEDLKRAIRHLEGRHVVVELDAKDHFIRRDGWPRTDIRTRSPRVQVSFQRPDGRWIVYPCDTFTTWEGNMRAIALTMQDLQRAGGRGVLSGEQYEGSTLALESGTAGIEGGFDVEWPGGALGFLAPYHDGPLGQHDHAGIRSAYRRAALRLHPDAGGDPVEFAALQRAYEVLAR